jgi:hypothetical protein
MRFDVLTIRITINNGALRPSSVKELVKCTQRMVDNINDYTLEHLKEAMPSATVTLVSTERVLKTYKCESCYAEGEVTTHAALADQPETVLAAVNFLLVHDGGLYCPKCRIPSVALMELLP